MVEGGGSGGGGWRWWPGGGGGRQATDRLRNYGQEGGRALTCYKTPTDTNTYLNTSTSTKCGQDITIIKNATNCEKFLFPESIPVQYV